MKDKVTQQDLVDKIKASDNILIMTAARARVDQLATCIGLFRILRDMDKNPALVYSKDIPGAISFLEPEKAIQTDAESLRDFIISFDRKKVDKFRYNQEGDQYNILLTPSRLEVITEGDMEYRKGDFNIDFILAVGVEDKAAVDPAVSEHKQLMDELPLVNIIAGKRSSSWEAACWHDEASPAAAEMVYELGKALGAGSFSKQVANSLLTGIIDQTERYKTRQTKSRTMHVSAELLEMGADLQLINENLSKAAAAPAALPEEETKEIIEGALGEAGEYDTKLIRNRRKKSGASGRRQYMRQGDVDGSGISYGEKAGSKKGQEQEYKLDKLDVDEEGNLRIISEEEEPGGEEAETPVREAGAALAPADQAQAPAAAGQARDSAMVSPAAPAAEAAPVMPHPAVNAPAGLSAPQPALGPAPAPAAQAPSISEMVDKTAASPGAPAVPGLNEKVAAMSPVNPGNAASYIDSLAGGLDSAPPVPGIPGAPAVPAAPPAGSDQAMTVDSYLAQQQTPPPPASQAPPVPHIPPSAPPLASMG